MMIAGRSGAGAGPDWWQVGQERDKGRRWEEEAEGVTISNEREGEREIGSEMGRDYDV